MKRVMCEILSLAAICLLIACNKSGKTAAGGGQKVELTWWATTSGPAELYQPAAEKLVRQYNETNTKNTHVTIEHIGNNAYEMLLTGIASGNAPDAMVSWSPHPMLLGLSGEGLPLNSIIDEWKAEGGAMINDVDQVMWDFNTAPDGTVYGLPYRYDPRIMTYRTDWFQQAGITTMPKTWNEFLDVLRKLKKTFPDKVPLIVGGGQYNAIHAIIGFGANNNTGWFDENMKPAMTSKAWIEMLEFFGTMYKEGLISEGSAAYTGDDMDKMYLAGEGAIMYRGVPSVVRGTELEAVSSIMPPLQGPSGTQQQTYAWVNGAFGIKSTKHPEETKAWLKWWTENNILMWTEGGCSNLPMRKSYQQTAAIQNDRFLKETVDAIAYGCVTNTYKVPYMYLEFGQIEGEGIPGNALREVMAGATNYAEIAKKYEDAMVAAIK
ncbi:sugar ABC transporter substrate-binding protein [Spirochaetia bacterium]|nr:sugar ABC transporter substrate-binding protein [Spirochaetia bacterium]